MNEKMSFEEAKKFWQWKWKRIMRKVLAGLFIAWAGFSGIGIIVFCKFFKDVPIRVPSWYALFATSLIMFIIIGGIIITDIILFPDEDD